jgi:hypothetical protein
VRVNTLELKECNTESYSIYEANKCTLQVPVKFRPTESNFIKEQNIDK